MYTLFWLSGPTYTYWISFHHPVHLPSLFWLVDLSYIFMFLCTTTLLPLNIPIVLWVSFYQNLIDIWVSCHQGQKLYHNANNLPLFLLGLASIRDLGNHISRKLPIKKINWSPNRFFIIVSPMGRLILKPFWWWDLEIFQALTPRSNLSLWFPWLVLSVRSLRGDCWKFFLSSPSLPQ